MKQFYVCVLISLLTAGCADQSGDQADGSATNGHSEQASSSNPATDEGSSTPGSNGVELNPENTNIEFIGTHVGPKPDPRTGRFEKFSGRIVLDPATSSVASIHVEIDTASLQTEIPKLTNHLKSPDFFDVREHPTAVFESRSITPHGEQAGMVDVTGDLALHGVTRSISFPATVTATAEGVKLESSFKIDRTQFGMDYGQQQVEKEVTLKVKVDA